MIASKRVFLSGLATMITAPAIASNESPVPASVMQPLPDVILRGVPKQVHTRLLWAANLGEELICSSGRKISVLTRWKPPESRVAHVDDREPLEWSVERHSDGTLYFKNIDEVMYTFEKDGVEYFRRFGLNHRYPAGVGHLKNISWSIDKELPSI